MEAAERQRRSPYQDLPPARFWRSGVAQHPIEFLPDLYRKKFDIAPNANIVTAGSCFAQHISRHLRAQGYRLVDAEPQPMGLPQDQAERFGYGLFSARYGNIYVMRQLLLLFKEAFGHIKPTNAVWEKDGRYYDALRPSVEPEGLASPQEVVLHREVHLEHVRAAFRRCDLFIFTLGLTEAWADRTSKLVFPTAPGSIAGRYDPAQHVCRNFSYEDVLRDFTEFRQLVQYMRPSIRFLLTVSPVPLTATATNAHVLVATTHSKAVLRAVAGAAAAQFPDVDYFPSYEIITTHASRGRFFAENLRDINADGVNTALGYFFREHPPQEPAAPNSAAPPLPEGPQPGGADVVCEEVLLQAFAP